MLDQSRVDAYLARLGAARPAAPDPDTLRDLQRRHLLTVPFENLSVLLGEDIRLTGADLVDKITERGRGGFCYELNGAFAALLTALGYRVSLLAARVHGREGLGPPFDHLILRVDLDAPWLVDVGFGRFFQDPLRWDLAGEQADPEGVFELRPAGHGDVDVLLAGSPEVRVETRPRELAEFGPTCWYHRTSPDSHFTRSLICSRQTPEGRVSIGGRTLIETVGGVRTETALEHDGEILAALRGYFGIELDALPPVPAGPA